MTFLSSLVRRSRDFRAFSLLCVGLGGSALLLAFSLTFGSLAEAKSNVIQPKLPSPNPAASAPANFPPSAAPSTIPQPFSAPSSSSQRVQAPPSEQLLILFDASSSMAEPLMTGEPKMVGAKRAIVELLQNIPPEVAVGLRVYGSTQMPNCQSGALLVPVSTGSQWAIVQAIQGVYPSGPTPISLNIMRAIKQDFLPVPGKKTILLISDGAENCDADPCRVAVDMVKAGVDVKIDVIGFGQLPPAEIRQLQCISAATFGEFQNVKTSAELVKALRKSVTIQTEVMGEIVPSGSGNSSQAQQQAEQAWQQTPSPLPTPPAPSNAKPGAKPKKPSVKKPSKASSFKPHVLQVGK
jgi:hypothetical protein